MNLSVIKNLKRYSGLFAMFLRNNLNISMSYRTIFFTELAVQLGYQVVAIVLVGVVYANVESVAGWTYYEMLFLIGLDILTTEVLFGVFVVFNMRYLPELIKDGVVDTHLLKPVDDMFLLTMGRPWTLGVLSGISGIYLIVYSFVKSEVLFSVINCMSFIWILVCGSICIYSFLVIITSLSFRFTNVSVLPNIGSTLMQFKRNPHQIYRGPLKVIFYVLIPVVFVGGIPSLALLRGIEVWYLAASTILAVLFVSFSRVVWLYMIKFYSSGGG